MPPKNGYQWPKTMEEYLRLRRAACEKFEPLISALQPWELDALVITASAELKNLREAAGAEAVRRGHRPPGTTIGGREGRY